MRTTRKRLILGGASAAAFVLASSAAFACLTPKGQITVQGNVATGDTVKAAASPAHASFCTLPVNEAQATATKRITVTVAASSCSGSASQLAGGTGQVVLQYDNTKYGWRRSAPGASWTWETGNGCFGPNKPASYVLGAISIVGGSGAAGFNVPSTMNLTSTANRAHHICVKDSGGADGAFAPFRIV